VPPAFANICLTPYREICGFGVSGSRDFRRSATGRSFLATSVSLLCYLLFRLLPPPSHASALSSPPMVCPEKSGCQKCEIRINSRARSSFPPASAPADARAIYYLARLPFHLNFSALCNHPGTRNYRLIPCSLDVAELPVWPYSPPSGGFGSWQFMPKVQARWHSGDMCSSLRKR